MRGLRRTRTPHVAHYQHACLPSHIASTTHPITSRTLPLGLRRRDQVPQRLKFKAGTLYDTTNPWANAHPPTKLINRLVIYLSLGGGDEVPKRLDQHQAGALHLLQGEVVRGGVEPVSCRGMV